MVSPDAIQDLSGDIGFEASLDAHAFMARCLCYHSSVFNQHDASALDRLTSRLGDILYENHGHETS